MIRRKLLDIILDKIDLHKKIFILYGARQVGKTTLLKEVVRKVEINSIWVNGDRAAYQEFLSVRNLEKIKELIGGASLIIIDEAQNVPDIGVNLKLIHDELPHVKVLVTGSSVLELANKTSETLAGRTITRLLYPISVEELLIDSSKFEVKQNLAQHLTYGLYPEVLTTSGGEDKRELLQEIVNSYLYKDILMLSNIRNSSKIFKLLQLLAYQIGSLVSIHELAKNLELNHETVNNYIDLLEKGFIIKRISGYSKNPRKEISKMDKIYFLDLGIRNALINDFSEVQIRRDLGNLWENFVVIERMKYLEYHNIKSNIYFWKRYSGAEIDLVEERDGKLYGTEIKWRKSRKNPPQSWIQDYAEASYQCVNKDNYLQFIS